ECSRPVCRLGAKPDWYFWGGCAQRKAPAVLHCLGGSESTVQFDLPRHQQDDFRPRPLQPRHLPGRRVHGPHLILPLPRGQCGPGITGHQQGGMTEGDVKQQTRRSGRADKPVECVCACTIPRRP
ncbi:hypothetical protein TCAP_05912, partial [Tolypocladium capitatum]